MERVQKGEAQAVFVLDFRHSLVSALALEVSSGEMELEGCACKDDQLMAWVSRTPAAALAWDPCEQEEEEVF